MQSSCPYHTMYVRNTTPLSWLFILPRLHLLTYSPTFRIFLLPQVGLHLKSRRREVCEDLPNFYLQLFRVCLALWLIKICSLSGCGLPEHSGHISSIFVSSEATQSMLFFFFSMLLNWRRFLSKGHHPWDTTGIYILSIKMRWRVSSYKGRMQPSLTSCVIKEKWINLSEPVFSLVKWRSCCCKDINDCKFRIMKFLLSEYLQFCDLYPFSSPGPFPFTRLLLPILQIPTLMSLFSCKCSLTPPHLWKVPLVCLSKVSLVCLSTSQVFPHGFPPSLTHLSVM